MAHHGRWTQAAEAAARRVGRKVGSTYFRTYRHRSRWALDSSGVVTRTSSEITTWTPGGACLAAACTPARCQRVAAILQAIGARGTRSRHDHAAIVALVMTLRRSDIDADLIGEVIFAARWSEAWPVLANIGGRPSITHGRVNLLASTLQTRTAPRLRGYPRSRRAGEPRWIPAIPATPWSGRSRVRQSVFGPATRSWMATTTAKTLNPNKRPPTSKPIHRWVSVRATVAAPPAPTETSGARGQRGGQAGPRVDAGVGACRTRVARGFANRKTLPVDGVGMVDQFQASAPACVRLPRARRLGLRGHDKAGSELGAEPIGSPGVQP